MPSLKLPLYPLRSFDRKLEEDGLVLLETIYGRFILDDKKLIGDFSDRRLQIVERIKTYKYPLYSLRRKINTLSQMINCSSTHYVDEQGNLLKRVKERFYKIVLKRVIGSTQIFNGKYHNYVAGCAQPFITKEPYEYLSLAIVDNTLVLFDVHRSKPEKVRLRVKI